MPQNINSVVLVGNLTRDPELRHTPSGTAVTTLRIAVNDRVKRGEEWTDAAYYFDVSNTTPLTALANPTPATDDRFGTAVASSWALNRKPPSPEMATTAASGLATLAPRAVG